MKFSRAGEKDIRISGYEARPSLNGWGYFSKRIAAEVTFVPCSDGMSDNTYKDTVTVIVDGIKYEGCGGGIVAPKP
jgi:heat shock protein HslJ